MKRKYYTIREIIVYADYKEEYTDGTWYFPHDHIQVKHNRTKSKYHKGKYLQQTPWYKPFK